MNLICVTFFSLLLLLASCGKSHSGGSGNTQGSVVGDLAGCSSPFIGGVRSIEEIVKEINLNCGIIDDQDIAYRCILKYKKLDQACSDLKVSYQNMGEGSGCRVEMSSGKIEPSAELVKECERLQGEVRDMSKTLQETYQL